MDETQWEIKQQLLSMGYNELFIDVAIARPHLKGKGLQAYVDFLSNKRVLELYLANHPNANLPPPQPPVMLKTDLKPVQPQQYPQPSQPMPQQYPQPPQPMPQQYPQPSQPMPQQYPQPPQPMAQQYPQPPQPMAQQYPQQIPLSQPPLPPARKATAKVPPVNLDLPAAPPPAVPTPALPPPALPPPVVPTPVLPPPAVPQQPTQQKAPPSTGRYAKIPVNALSQSPPQPAQEAAASSLERENSSEQLQQTVPNPASQYGKLPRNANHLSMPPKSISPVTPQENETPMSAPAPVIDPSQQPKPATDATGKSQYGSLTLVLSTNAPTTTPVGTGGTSGTLRKLHISSPPGPSPIPPSTPAPPIPASPHPSTPLPPAPSTPPANVVPLSRPLPQSSVRNLPTPTIPAAARPISPDLVRPAVPPPAVAQPPLPKQGSMPALKRPAPQPYNVPRVHYGTDAHFSLFKTYSVICEQNPKFRSYMEDTHFIMDNFGGTNLAYFGIYGKLPLA